MEWVFGVTAFNWALFLLALIKGRSLALEFLILFAFSTLLLIGPIAVQNSLMVWTSWAPGSAWAATLVVMLWIIPVGAFSFRSPKALNGIIIVWYLIFLGLVVAGAAEVWNLGYLYTGLIFFWPLVAVVIPAGLAIHKMVKRETSQPHENGNAPE